MKTKTPEIDWKRDMSGGIMMATSEAFDAACSSVARTEIMKATAKAT